MTVIIKFTDGEVQIENLENSIFGECPFFRNILDSGFGNSAEETIDFPALNKNFSKKEFDEYTRYLSLDNKNAFVFSREWTNHVAQNPMLALNFVHFTNFLMDDEFNKHVCQYALQTIFQFEIELQHLVEHINTFAKFLSEEQFESFFDILFIRKRDSLNHQVSPDNLLAQQSLKYILERLALVSRRSYYTPRAYTSSNQPGECQLVFNTFEKRVILPVSLSTDTVRSLQNKLASHLSELSEKHVQPNQISIICGHKVLTDNDLRSGNAARQTCLHAILDPKNTLIQEKILNRLDENIRYEIQTTLLTAASFTEKILNFNNNFGNEDISDCFKGSENSLILLKQKIERNSIQSDDKNELLRAVDFALIQLSDAQHYIHLYGKLFNQGILIGNIPKEIKSIEALLASNPLKNQNSLNQFEAKAFDTFKLILRSISSINTSDIELNEEEQSAREMLHEQMMRYLGHLNIILLNACREVVLPTNTLFDVTQLLNDTTNIVDSSPISLPQANNTPVSKKLDAPIVVALDHGGVLDGATCDSRQENAYINSQTDLIWKRDDELGLTYFLPDGVAILERLNELAQKGVVISSHSNNVFADQLELFRGLKQAAESKGLPFPQLGRLAIYQRNHEASADNPQHASINDPILGSIETLTFGQVKSETGEILEVPRNGWGKEHIRQIITTSYGIPKENLHVFDDAGGICSVAGSEGHTAYWCGQRDVDVANAVKDIDHQDDITYQHRGTQMSLSKQPFLIHLNTMLASLSHQEKQVTEQSSTLFAQQPVALTYYNDEDQRIVSEEQINYRVNGRGNYYVEDENSGGAVLQGRRVAQEDRMTDLKLSDEEHALYQNLSDEQKNEILNNTYAMLNQEINAMSFENDPGSTSITAVLEENRIRIANLGDSQITAVVLNKDGKLISSDRLNALHNPPEGRLAGMLAVNRAFGDNYFIQFGLNQTPELQTYDTMVQENEQIFYVLSSDGLLERGHITEEAIGQFIAAHRHQSLGQLAFDLATQAFNRGSTDNISIRIFKASRASNGTYIYNIFDGHGGDAVSQYLKDHFNRAFKNALRTILGLDQVSVDPTPISDFNHNIIEDDIIIDDTNVDAKLLHDLIINDNLAINDLIGIFGNSSPEQLFEAACHPDEEGMPLLHKIILNKSDREALNLIQFLTQSIVDIIEIPRFQGTGEEQGISLEYRAFQNEKFEVARYLRNLRKANPTPITADAHQQPIDVPPRAPLVVPGFDGLKKRSREEPIQTSKVPVDGNKIFSKKAKRSEEENPQPDMTRTNTSSSGFGRLWALPSKMLDAAASYIISVSPQLNGGDADSNTAEDRNNKKHKREPRQ